MKISKGLLSLISYACLIISFPVIAKTNTSLVSPKKGVICDQYICVNNKGVSKSLTAQYLGTQKANKVFSQGDLITLHLLSQMGCSAIQIQNDAM